MATSPLVPSQYSSLFSYKEGEGDDAAWFDANVTVADRALGNPEGPDWTAEVRIRCAGNRTTARELPEDHQIDPTKEMMIDGLRKFADYLEREG